MAVISEMLTPCRPFVLLFALLLQRPVWSAEDRVVVACKTFPESRLLAEVMAQLIEANTDFEVDRKYGLGGTMVCLNAILTGAVDLYPEYTGTGLLSILNEQPGAVRTSDAIYLRVKQQFSDMFERDWLERLGFSNSYVLAARPGLGISTISDLKQVQETIRVRFQHEFLKRADGYPGIQATYGVNFRDVQGMKHGLAYVALSKGQIDLMDAYSTDGMLKLYDVLLLENDLHLFPPYDAAPVIRQDTLSRYPGLRELLAQLDGRISQAKMIAMNYEVLRREKSIAEIASDFLIAESLIDQESAYQSTWQDSVMSFLRMLTQHLFLTLTATVLATVVGITVGLLVARKSESLAGPVMGLVGILQTIPSLAMLAFMIPLLGIGALPAIAALFLYGLLPIVRNTYTGISSVPTELKEAGMGMGMTPRQLLMQLELPLAMKTIMAEIRTALVISVGTATLGSFIGAGGFGDPINTGLQQRDNVQILWGAIPAALLALGCDWGMARLENRIGPQGL